MNIDLQKSLVETYTFSELYNGDIVQSTVTDNWYIVTSPENSAPIALTSLVKWKQNYSGTEMSIWFPKTKFYKMKTGDVLTLTM